MIHPFLPSSVRMISHLDEVKPNHFPGLPRRRFSRDDVLALIRDAWRLPKKIEHDADLILEIHPAMTIAEFRRALGKHSLTFDWRELARWFEYHIGGSIGHESWKRVLLPERSKTLSAVLDLLAEHALDPAMPRSRDGHTIEWVDSALESLKAALSARGVDASDITPETRLNRLIARAPLVFQQDLSRLTPGRMPPLRKRHRFLYLILAIVLVMTTLFLLGLQPWFPIPMLVSNQLLFFIWPTFVLLSHPKLQPHDYKLGELITVEDLCYLLTSPPPHGDEDVIEL